MGRFRSAPHHGHLERVQRICGYLRKRPDGAVRLHINIPDNLHTAPGDHNWDTTVYGNVTEELPHDMPTPKGKPVRMTTFEDANLLHDISKWVRVHSTLFGAMHSIVFNPAHMHHIGCKCTNFCYDLHPLFNTYHTN